MPPKNKQDAEPPARRPATKGAPEHFAMTPDKLIAEVIGKAWLKDLDISLELRNLDFETHKSGQQPNHVVVTLVVQQVTEPYQTFDFDGSGSYMGEACEMVAQQFRAHVESL
jgi:hypothetical protein